MIESFSRTCPMFSFLTKFPTNYFKIISDLYFRQSSLNFSEFFWNSFNNSQKLSQTFYKLSYDCIFFSQRFSQKNQKILRKDWTMTEKHLKKFVRKKIRSFWNLINLFIDGIVRVASGAVFPLVRICPYKYGFFQKYGFFFFKETIFIFFIH